MSDAGGVPVVGFPEQEAIFRSIGFLDTLSEGLMLINLDGLITACNQTALNLLGVTRDDVIARDISDPVWGGVKEDGTTFTGPEFPAAMTLRTGQPCTDVLVGVDIPADGRRWMSTTTRLVQVDGHTVGVSNAFVDVSHLMAEKRALSTFTQLSQVLTNPAKEKELLANLCSEIILLGGYALAWIGVVNEGVDPTIEIEASSGEVDYLFIGQGESSEHLPNGLGFTSTAMRTREIQISNDLARETHGEAWRERAREFGFGSVVAIPITIGEELLAVLTIYGREASAFDGPSEILLEKMATAFSLGLAHLRDTRRLAAAFDGTLLAIGKMSEVRDPYTAGHQQNVGQLGAAIAEHMGLEPAMADLIRQSGAVHDIGKFSTPAEILARPGSLETEEFALIKRHPEVGFKILSEASVPWPLAEVALEHHERIDGSGYPAGLKGDAICLPARIIAVADVVEAMMHRRPYREALGIDAALAEIQQGAGTLYDLDVAQGCSAVFAAGFTF